MGFGIFEAVWRTISGTVMWSTDVDFGNEGTISFRLKSKDNLSYVVMVFKLTAGALYYPMDLSDLRNLEGALRATRKQLEPSRLGALAREKVAEMMRLGILERTWRWVIDTPLWKEDVVFENGGKISFRIRRKQDRRAEISFKSGEETFHLPVQLRGLEALEDALSAIRTALGNTRKSD